MEGHHSCEDLFEGLSLLADGETQEAKCRQAMAHVGDCEPCRRYLESLQATRGALGQVAQVTRLDASELDLLLTQCREALRAKFPALFPTSPPR